MCVCVLYYKFILYITRGAPNKAVKKKVKGEISSIFMKIYTLLFGFLLVSSSCKALKVIQKCKTEQAKSSKVRQIRLSFTSSLKDTVSEYKCKVQDGNKDLDETIKIVTKKETETFQIASNGGMSI